MKYLIFAANSLVSLCVMAQGTPGNIGVSVSAPTMGGKAVTIAIDNGGDFPRAVLVQIHNESLESKQISEVAVNVPARSRVSAEAAAVGESFVSPLKYRYFYDFGMFDPERAGNAFQIPFERGVNAVACQTPDGPITTHHDRMHAIDFCAKEGTPVVAAKSGVVINVVDTYREGGMNPDLLRKDNKIVLLHDNGMHSFYGHIYPGSATVKIGDKVAQGQRLALVGNVGYTAGPHLHFEIREVVPSLDGGKQLTRVIQPNFEGKEKEPIKIVYGEMYDEDGVVKRSDEKIQRSVNVAVTGGQKYPAAPLQNACSDTSADAVKRANDCYLTGNLEDVVTLLKAHLHSNKKDARAYGILAMTLARKKEFQESIVYFEKRVAMGRYGYDVCAYYAISLAGVGRLKESISWNRRALEMVPGLIDVTKTLAMQLVEVGRKVEAVELLRNFDDVRSRKGMNRLFESLIRDLAATN